MSRTVMMKALEILERGGARVHVGKPDVERTLNEYCNDSLCKIGRSVRNLDTNSLGRIHVLAVCNSRSILCTHAAIIMDTRCSDVPGT